MNAQMEVLYESERKIIDGTSGCSDEEGYGKLFDGKYTESDGTKWCCDFSDSAYVIIEASEPVGIGGYTFVTGNDNARESGRNPKTWKLYGCEAYRFEDEDNSWTEIASVTGDTTMQDKNYTSYPFSVDGNETKYQYYKFEFTANQGADVMQLSEILFDYNVCDHEWVNGETQAATCTSEKLKAGNVGKNAFANGSDEVIVKTSKKKLEAYKKLLKKRGISKNASFES